MQLFLMPAELLGLLFILGPLISLPVSASPAVNVALQASFNAPPYILELLSVIFAIIHVVRLKLTSLGRLLQRRTALPISPSSIESRTGTFRIAAQTKSFMVLS